MDGARGAGDDDTASQRYRGGVKMDRFAAQSSEVLLARVNRELERISDTQHRLARRRTFLQEQATRLRLGASPIEVRFTLRANAMDEDEHTALANEWAEPSKADANGTARRSVL
jgi:hypothetical protein